MAKGGSGEREKQKRKGKGKKADAEEEEGEEKWQMETQARFLHAQHELDYLGFIETVYDIAE